METQEKLKSELNEFINNYSSIGLMVKVEALQNAIHDLYMKDTSSRFIFCEKPLCWLKIVKNTFNNNQTQYCFQYEGLPEAIVYNRIPSADNIYKDALNHGIVFSYGKKSKASAPSNSEASAPSNSENKTNSEVKTKDNTSSNSLENAYSDVFNDQVAYNSHVINITDSDVVIHKLTFRVYRRILEMFNSQDDLIAECREKFDKDMHVGTYWKNRSGEKTLALLPEAFEELVNLCSHDIEKSDTTDIKEILKRIKSGLLGEVLNMLEVDGVSAQDVKLMLRDMRLIHINNGSKNSDNSKQHSTVNIKVPKANVPKKMDDAADSDNVSNNIPNESKEPKWEDKAFIVFFKKSGIINEKEDDNQL